MRTLCLTFCFLLIAGCSWTGYTLVDTDALKVQAKYTEKYVTESNKLWKDSGKPEAEEYMGIGDRLTRNVKAMLGEEK